MKTQRVVSVAIAAIVLLLTYLWSERNAIESVTTPDEQGIAAINAAYAAQRSGVMVEVQGRVDAVLRDDTDGSRHQRFILRLSDGHTLLVSHNIDLAPRAPLAVGDTVSLRGQYEWNAKGGVLHWTHHDPQGRREGGWVEVRGKRYR